MPTEHLKDQNGINVYIIAITEEDKKSSQCVSMVNTEKGWIALYHVRVKSYFPLTSMSPDMSLE